MATKKEIARRTTVALAASKKATDDADSSVQLFASHHLEELAAEYWQQHTGTARPSGKQVLELLVLRSHWGENAEDGIDVFDFTLPDDITDYVLSVRFDEDGAVEDVSMES